MSETPEEEIARLAREDEERQRKQANDEERARIAEAARRRRDQGK